MVRALRVGLRVTTVMNVGAAVFALAMPAVAWPLLYGSTMPVDPMLWRHHVLLWGFVLALGAGYGVASVDPVANRGLLVAGGAGKLVAAAVWAEMVAHALAAPILATGVLFDGSLGMLFLVAAWRTR